MKSRSESPKIGSIKSIAWIDSRQCERFAQKGRGDPLSTSSHWRFKLDSFGNLVYSGSESVQTALERLKGGGLPEVRLTSVRTRMGRA